MAVTAKKLSAETRLNKVLSQGYIAVLNADAQQLVMVQQQIAALNIELHRAILTESAEKRPNTEHLLQVVNRATTLFAGRFEEALIQNIDAVANTSEDMLADAITRYDRKQLSAITGISRLTVDAMRLRQLGDQRIALSDRIWRVGYGMNRELNNLIVNSALVHGHFPPARELSRTLQAFLLPDGTPTNNDMATLFGDEWQRNPVAKRVKTKSPAWQAMRLARTEVNHTFHTAVDIAATQIVGCIGTRVILSQTHGTRMPEGDICDEWARYEAPNVLPRGVPLQDVKTLAETLKKYKQNPTGVYQPGGAPLEHPNGLCTRNLVLVPTEQLADYASEARQLGKFPPRSMNVGRQELFMPRVASPIDTLAEPEVLRRLTNPSEITPEYAAWLDTLTDQHYAALEGWANDPNIRKTIQLGLSTGDYSNILTQKFREAMDSAPQVKTEWFAGLQRPANLSVPAMRAQWQKAVGTEVEYIEPQAGSFDPKIAAKNVPVLLRIQSNRAKNLAEYGIVSLPGKFKVIDTGYIENESGDEKFVVTLRDITEPGTAPLPKPQVIKLPTTPEEVFQHDMRRILQQYGDGEFFREENNHVVPGKKGWDAEATVRRIGERVDDEVARRLEVRQIPERQYSDSHREVLHAEGEQQQASTNLKKIHDNIFEEWVKTVDFDTPVLRSFVDGLAKVKQERANAVDGSAEANSLDVRIESLTREIARRSPYKTVNELNIAANTEHLISFQNALDNSPLYFDAKKRFTESQDRVAIARKADDTLHDQEAIIRRDTYLEVLKEVRPFGLPEGTRLPFEYPDPSEMMIHNMLADQRRSTTSRYTDADKFFEDQSDVQNAVVWATQFYPTDWLRNVQTKVKNDAANIRLLLLDRGYARSAELDGSTELAVSNSHIEIDSDPRFAPTALHELGHHQEYANPDLRAAEWAFYQRRTRDGIADANLPQEPLLPLGGQYPASEVSRIDKFELGYMGKDYSKGYQVDPRDAPHELLTVAMESLFTNKYGGLREDDDMRHWLLGTLLTTNRNGETPRLQSPIPSTAEGPLDPQFDPATSNLRRDEAIFQWKLGLTEQEKDALRDWVTDSHNITTDIRHNTRTESMHTDAFLSALAKAPSAKGDILYRGLGDYASEYTQYERMELVNYWTSRVGERISWPVPESTTLEADQAFDFGSVILKLQHSGAKHIGGSEREALTPVGAEFEVVSAQHVEGPDGQNALLVVLKEAKPIVSSPVLEPLPQEIDFTYEPNVQYALQFTHNGLSTSNISVGRGPTGLWSRITGNIVNQDGLKVGSFERRYIPRTHAMFHTETKLDKDYQGLGFGSAFFEHSMGFYKASYVEEVRALAADTGGYTLASKGMDFDNADQGLRIAHLMADNPYGWTVNDAGEAIANKPPKNLDAGTLRLTQVWADALKTRIKDWEAGNAAPLTAYSLSQWSRENIWKDDAGRTMWMGKAGMLGSEWSGIINLKPKSPPVIEKPKVENKPGKGYAIDMTDEDDVTKLFSFTHNGLSSVVDRFDVQYGQMSVSGRIVDEDTGEDVGTFSRDFDLHTGDMHHSYFAIDDEMQGRGFGGAFIDRMFEFYKHSHVATASVQANIDIGGYTWATKGFDFEDQYDARRIAEYIIHKADNVEDYLDRYTGQDKIDAIHESGRKLQEKLNSGDEFTAHELSQWGREPELMWKDDEGRDMWIGKIGMLGTNWNGTQTFNPDDVGYYVDRAEGYSNDQEEDYYKEDKTDEDKHEAPKPHVNRHPNGYVIDLNHLFEWESFYNVKTEHFRIQEKDVVAARTGDIILTRGDIRNSNDELWGSFIRRYDRTTRTVTLETTEFDTENMSDADRVEVSEFRRKLFDQEVANYRANGISVVLAEGDGYIYGTKGFDFANDGDALRIAQQIVDYPYGQDASGNALPPPAHISNSPDNRAKIANSLNELEDRIKLVKSGRGDPLTAHELANWGKEFYWITDDAATQTIPINRIGWLGRTGMQGQNFKVRLELDSNSPLPTETPTPTPPTLIPPNQIPKPVDFRRETQVKRLFAVEHNGLRSVVGNYEREDNYVTIGGRIEDVNTGATVGRFKRVYDMTTKDMSHEDFRINEGYDETRGFANEFFRQTVAYYDLSGVKSISGYAEQTNGYLWASKGYDFTGPGAATITINNVLAFPYGVKLDSEGAEVSRPLPFSLKDDPKLKARVDADLYSLRVRLSNAQHSKEAFPTAHELSQWGRENSWIDDDGRVMWIGKAGMLNSRWSSTIDLTKPLPTTTKPTITPTKQLAFPEPALTPTVSAPLEPVNLRRHDEVKQVFDMTYNGIKSQTQTVQIFAYDNFGGEQQLFGGEDPKKYKFADGRVRIEGIIIDTDTGQQIGRFRRNYDYADRVMTHNLMTIDPAYQGRGFGSVFLQQSLDQYRQAGVKQIDVHANLDIGGYTWASKGFDFAFTSDGDRVIGNVFEKINRLIGADAVDLPSEFRDNPKKLKQLQASLDALQQRWTDKSAEPISAQELSQWGRELTWRDEQGRTLWLGKFGMLNQNWDGVFKL